MEADSINLFTPQVFDKVITQGKYCSWNRVIILELEIFGFLRAIFTYFITFKDCLFDPSLVEMLEDWFVHGFVYVICGFALSSLFLSAERWIAVCKPKAYERYSASTKLAAGTFITTVFITGITGLSANMYRENQWPLIIVTTASGIMSLIIAIIVWKRAKILWKNKTLSLSHRFQIAETNRTSPIYLSISVNESLCIMAMSVIGFLMLQLDHAEAIVCDHLLVHLVDAFGAWRIIFIDLTLIYYYLMAKKSRKMMLAQMAKEANKSAADYFSELKASWK
ncbi:hypothetical protein GCK32_008902 [Trichostrongylus colubriformis]|uniref:Uncharacterized protein n=1 Tax=Trichostrongylus colubriformis TaxID=6319 RepID=A0AAN8FRK8_TRICO